MPRGRSGNHTHALAPSHRQRADVQRHAKHQLVAGPVHVQRKVDKLAGTGANVGDNAVLLWTRGRHATQLLPSLSLPPRHGGARIQIPGAAMLCCCEAGVAA